MDVLVSTFSILQILAFIDTSKYALLFFACFFEGTLAMMTGGLLWSLGSVSFWPMYFTLLAADVAADTCWYALGRFGTRAFVERWGRAIGITASSLSRVEDRFKRYDVQIILLSKLTMGFGLAIPTLITAGTLHVPYRRFLMINTIGAFAWVLAMIILGAYVGDVFKPLALSQQIMFGALAFVFVTFGIRYAQNVMSESKW